MNQLRQAITNHDFLITAEVAPPKGTDPHHMVEMAHKLKHHVHAINITDGSRAVMRMSSLASALILQNQGIEAICQVTCRDRNRIGLQSDLLGAQALGIRTVLALTGDPVKAGDQPDARPVFDLESVRLIQLIHNLNQGLDYNAKALPDGATDLLIGAAVDPQLPNLESLQKRFERKLNAGAQFFQSQLITDFDRLEQFMVKIAAGHKTPILAGIFLLKSAKNAEFINRYVPGVQIPQSIIDRLAKSDSPLQEGIAIAAEQVRHAKQLCQGVHMMAVNREDLIPEILTQAGLAPIQLSSPNSHAIPSQR
jgi:methylenetetrahydrofolate reductase (NADPH)